MVEKEMGFRLQRTPEKVSEIEYRDEFHTVEILGLCPRDCSFCAKKVARAVRRDLKVSHWGYSFNFASYLFIRS